MNFEHKTSNNNKSNTARETTAVSSLPMQHHYSSSVSDTSPAWLAHTAAASESESTSQIPSLQIIPCYCAVVVVDLVLAVVEMFVEREGAEEEEEEKKKKKIGFVGSPATRLLWLSLWLLLLLLLFQSWMALLVLGIPGARREAAGAATVSMM